MKKQRPLRIWAYSKKVPNAPGYVGTSTECYQEIQEKRWWGWVTIDREELPSWALINQGCFGDTGGWESKFAKLGSWSRGKTPLSFIPNENFYKTYA